MSGRNCHTDKYKIQKWCIQIIDYPYMNDVNLQCWIEMRHFCFTSQSKMFQSYLCSTSMYRLTEEDGPIIGFLCHRHFVGFLLCPSRHRHGATLFPLILKNRTPLSSSGNHQMIELLLKKYMWMPPLLGVEFQLQVHRCATGIMLTLCSEGRLFELRCPRVISGRTSDGKEVKRHIRTSEPV